MTENDKNELLREMRQDIKDLHTKLDGFLERVSAAEVYIKGHSTLFIFLGTAILGIISYLISGEF